MLLLAASLILLVGAPISEGTTRKSRVRGMHVGRRDDARFDHAVSARARPAPHSSGGGSQSGAGWRRPRNPAGIPCKESWFEQKLDHFSWSNDSTWQQRYFICDKDWRRPSPLPWRTPGPMFFYCGNEADVEGYVEHTGLMYENAAAFGALLIFAEHRYYGQSLPLGEKTFDNMHFLTHEQALADYATLIQWLKTDLGAENSDVIAFGGSYGGMLAAWFRMKYPDIILGSIAASAPILAFPGADGAEEYADGGEGYWAVVTRDASSAAGASSQCIPGFRAAWDAIDKLGITAAGRAQVSSAFGLCEPLSDDVDVEYLKLYIAMSVDTMAMGNFPYASDYLTGGDGFMPPWPVRVACDKLVGVDSSEPNQLLAAISAAAAVFYNATGRMVRPFIFYFPPPLFPLLIFPGGASPFLSAMH